MYRYSEQFFFALKSPELMRACVMYAVPCSTNIICACAVILCVRVRG